MASDDGIIDKLGKGIQAAVAGARGAFNAGHWMLAGKPVCCSHCSGSTFQSHWKADLLMTTLTCDTCGQVTWYHSEPEPRT